MINAPSGGLAAHRRLHKDGEARDSREGRGARREPDIQGQVARVLRHQEGPLHREAGAALSDVVHRRVPRGQAAPGQPGRRQDVRGRGGRRAGQRHEQHVRVEPQAEAGLQGSEEQLHYMRVPPLPRVDIIRMQLLRFNCEAASLPGELFLFSGDKL